MMSESLEKRIARRAERYQIAQDYIKKYREGDTFYHVTLQENAHPLVRDGFDPERVGTGGGCQGGAGFSCTWCEADAWDWGRKIYGWSNQDRLAVVKVSLPGVYLASWQQCDEMAEDAITWGREQGYLVSSSVGMSPTEKLNVLYKNQPFMSDPAWAVIGQYLLSRGFDGYWVGMEEIIILNFSLLKPEVFSHC